MAPDIKTGQHIDIPKREIIVPALTNFITEAFSEQTRPLGLLDLGGGDSSTSLALIECLKGRNIQIGAHALVDRDQNVFPDALGNIFKADILTQASVGVIQPDRARHLGPDVEAYKDAFDVAVANLMLHQTTSQAELTLLMFRAATALKDSGRFYITELHPDFLSYLQENEPEKLHLEGSVGEYSFDSGGSVKMVNRTIQDTLASAISVGFKLNRYSFPSIQSIEKQKPRYEKLIKEGIPMFYIMELQKNPNGFISSTEGVVAGAVQHGTSQMRIDLADGEFVIIPISENIIKIKNGDRIVLSDILLPDHRIHLNMWVIPKVEDEEIWSSQWTSKTPV
jgi:hypothetical protein